MVTKQAVNSLKYYIKSFSVLQMCLLCTKNKSWVFKKGKSLKLGILRNIFKNHGCFVIKEIFKKEGILKPGNFFQKTYKLFKNPTFNHLKNYKKMFLYPMFL